MLGGHHGSGEPRALGVEAGYLGRVGLRAGATRLEHQDERRKGHAEKLSRSPGRSHNMVPWRA